MDNDVIDTMFPAGLKNALAALYGTHKPMTEQDLAEHQSRCSDEMARAQARRNPTPQPDLLYRGA